MLFFFISLLERATHAPSVFDARLLKVTGREMRWAEVLLRVVLSRARKSERVTFFPLVFVKRESEKSAPSEKKIKPTLRW